MKWGLDKSDALGCDIAILSELKKPGNDFIQGTVGYLLQGKISKSI